MLHRHLRIAQDEYFGKSKTARMKLTNETGWSLRLRELGSIKAQEPRRTGARRKGRMEKGERVELSAPTRCTLWWWLAHDPKGGLCSGRTSCHSLAPLGCDLIWVSMSKDNSAAIFGPGEPVNVCQCILNCVYFE